MKTQRLLALMMTVLLWSCALLTVGCGSREEEPFHSSDSIASDAIDDNSATDLNDGSTTMDENGESEDASSTIDGSTASTSGVGTNADSDVENTDSTYSKNDSSKTQSSLGASDTTTLTQTKKTNPSKTNKPTVTATSSKTKKPAPKPSDLIPVATKTTSTPGQQPTDPVEKFLSSFRELVISVAECDMNKIKSVSLADGSIVDSYMLTSADYDAHYCFHLQYVKGKKVIMANVTVEEDAYDFLFTVFAYYICHSLNLNGIDSDTLFDGLEGLPAENNFKSITASGYQVSCYLPAEYVSFTAAAVGHTIASAEKLESRLTEAECKACFCDPTRSVNYMKLTDNGKKLGFTDKILSRALINGGNQARLAKAMNKAKAGGDLTFAAIGGSVTEGAFASNYSTLSYAGLTNAWLKKAFPKSKVEFVHKGIGGTSSLLGVHRIEEDVLKYNPDIVVIEYAVNDTKNKYQQEAYASLVRRVLEHESQPAVILLFVMDENGKNVQNLQIPVGEHYDLPMISHANAIWPEVKTASNPDGQYLWSDIGADYVHPTNKGHAIISELLCSYLQKTYDKLSTISTSVPALPESYLGYTFKDAVWYNYSNITPKSMGNFVKYTSDGCSWKSNGKQPIVFEVTGKRIFIPTSAAKGEDFDVTVRIDGGTPIKLNKESKEFGGGRYINYLVLDEQVSSKHTIEITCNSGTLYLGGLFVS